MTDYPRGKTNLDHCLALPPMVHTHRLSILIIQPTQRSSLHIKALLGFKGNCVRNDTVHPPEGWLPSLLHHTLLPPVSSAPPSQCSPVVLQVPTRLERSLSRMIFMVHPCPSLSLSLQPRPHSPGWTSICTKPPNQERLSHPVQARSSLKHESLSISAQAKGNV